MRESVESVEKMLDSCSGVQMLCVVAAERKATTTTHYSTSIYGRQHQQSVL